MTEPLETVEIEPPIAATRAVVWLHGLGADGHDFAPVVPWLGLPTDAPIRFVFPHALPMPVTINAGMVMRAWYDITGLDPHARHDEAGVRASAARVRQLVEREAARGVPPEHVVLAGFSQGGAVALFEGLRHPQRLAGLMALSSYLVCPDVLGRERGEANADTTIFQAHGTHDPMVAIERGRETRQRLEEWGHTVEWHEYPMAHQVCPEEIEAVGVWLRRVLL